METKLAPLIAIVGETATGKSAIALALAQQFNGEIICADSWTVYKGFDIGTAKPSKQDQAIVPHHLLDVADPREGYSVVEFKRKAEQAITEMTNRGKLPILVGGSGLYIDAVLYNYQFLPAGPIGQRKELNLLSLDELQQRVAIANFATTDIDTRNKRRLIRLLETNGQRPTKSNLRSNSLIIGISPSRDMLKKQVNDRVDAMFKEGLEREVRNLAEVYGWAVEPMKGIGYREFQEYIEGTQSLEETKAKITQGTLRLAKKQRTWFKRNSSIHWENDLSKIVEILTTFLNKNK